MLIVRTVQASLTLDQEGYACEAAPLRRTCIEHVTGLAWPAEEGNDAADSLIRLNAEQARRRLQSVQNADWSTVNQEAFTEVIEDGEEADKGTLHLDNAWHFVPRNTNYGTVHYLPVWLAETAHSHPSWASASPYMVPGDDERAALLDEPIEAPIYVYSTATFVLVDGLAAMNLMLEGHPFTARLRTIIQRVRDIDTAVRRERGQDIPAEYSRPILPHLP